MASALKKCRPRLYSYLSSEWSMPDGLWSMYFSLYLALCYRRSRWSWYAHVITIDSSLQVRCSLSLFFLYELYFVSYDMPWVPNAAKTQLAQVVSCLRTNYADVKYPSLLFCLPTLFSALSTRSFLNTHKARPCPLRMLWAATCRGWHCSPIERL